jgi:hypothetical protein
MFAFFVFTHRHSNFSERLTDGIQMASRYYLKYVHMAVIVNEASRYSHSGAAIRRKMIGRDGKEMWMRRGKVMGA